MSKGNASKRLRAEDYRIDSADRPGWVVGSKRMLKTGMEVYCIGGHGIVTAVRGKTGDGSQLLEIKLADESAKPFFASASNVLVAPR
jgi:hypothetical protein